MFHKEPPRVAQLAALIAQHTGATPYLAASVADTLTSCARQLRRIYERRCNGYSDGRGNWDHAAEERDNKREKRLINRAQKTCGELAPCHFATQGDPRGAALYLWFAGHRVHRDRDSAFAIY